MHLERPGPWGREEAGVQGKAGLNQTVQAVSNILRVVLRARGVGNRCALFGF